MFCILVVVPGRDGVKFQAAILYCGQTVHIKYYGFRVIQSYLNMAPVGVRPKYSPSQTLRTIQ